MESKFKITGTKPVIFVQNEIKMQKNYVNFIKLKKSYIKKYF